MSTSTQTYLFRGILEIPKYFQISQYQLEVDIRLVNSNEQTTLFYEDDFFFSPNNIGVRYFTFFYLLPHYKIEKHQHNEELAF